MNRFVLMVDTIHKPNNKSRKQPLQFYCLLLFSSLQLDIAVKMNLYLFKLKKTRKLWDYRKCTYTTVKKRRFDDDSFVL